MNATEASITATKMQLVKIPLDTLFANASQASLVMDYHVQVKFILLSVSTSVSSLVCFKLWV